MELRIKTGGLIYKRMRRAQYFSTWRKYYEYRRSKKNDRCTPLGPPLFNTLQPADTWPNSLLIAPTLREAKKAEEAAAKAAREAEEAEAARKAEEEAARLAEEEAAKERKWKAQVDRTNAEAKRRKVLKVRAVAAARHGHCHAASTYAVVLAHHTAPSTS